jgi:hypothetical protein
MFIVLVSFFFLAFPLYLS